MSNDSSPSSPSTSALAHGVSRIRATLDELRRDAPPPSKDVSVYASLSAVERPSVVGLFGESGSGKTTLLRHTCLALAEEPDRLVIPPISPERFAAGDSLFGWTLAELQALLIAERPEVLLTEVQLPAPRGRMMLKDLIVLLRHQESLAHSGVAAGGNPARASIDEIARERAAVTTSGLELTRGWLHLINALMTPQAGGYSQVVVPVDDGDQVPTLVGQIFRDLRWVTTHPRVAAIFCANPTMIEDVVAHATGAASIDMPRAKRLQHATSALIKVLPEHLRHETPELTFSERLSFAPIDQDGPTLRQLLERFPVAADRTGRLSSLSEYFTFRIGADAVPSAYAALLPKLPRLLEQLWHSIRHLSSLERIDAYRTATAAKTLIERALDREHVDKPDVLEETVSFSETGDEVGVELDLTSIAFGTQAGRGARVYADSRRTVGIRRVDAFTAMARADVERDAVSPDRVPLLSESYATALRLLVELSDDSITPEPPLDFIGYFGDLGQTGGTAWTSTDVRVEGGTADNAYLVLPRWDSYYDVTLFRHAWNLLVDAVRSSPGHIREDERLVEWIIFMHIDLVVQVQSTRSIERPDFPHGGDEYADLLDSWSMDDHARALTERIASLYAIEDDSPVERVRDFQEWVEILMPWCADPAVSTPASAAAVLKMRADVIGDGLAEADARASDRLVRRIEAHVGEPWARQTIELLREFSPERAHTLSEASAVAQRDRLEEHRLFDDALENMGVPEDVRGAVFIHGLRPDVTAQLRSLGVPQSAIEILSQRFPPRDGESLAQQGD